MGYIKRTGNRITSLPTVPSIKMFMDFFLFEFAYVCICTIYMPGTYGGQKSVESFEIRLRDDCEPPWELNPGPQQERNYVISMYTNCVYVYT